MAAENITWYFARAWEDDDDFGFTTREHEYELNSIALVAVAILVFAITRFTTYSVDRLLLLNFPSLSREWCFTTATQPHTKLQRAQDRSIKIAVVVSLLCRWPLGLLFPLHLWQTVASIGCLLTIAELSFVILLGMTVGFIRAAHHTAQITGWEHPDSPSRGFSPGESSKKEDCRFVVSPAIVSSDRSINNASRDTTHIGGSTSNSDSISFNDSQTTMNSTAINPHTISITAQNTDTTATDPTIIHPTQSSSFMTFSHVALSKSTWLRTRTFATSIFSTSTQSTCSCDSFGGPAARHSGSLGTVRNGVQVEVDKGGEGLDLLTGTPRRG